ncbi:MAG TPA: sigma-54 dependent transcriptional regulator [Candidatus Binataceae bacterium]|nr:sigma-54 dependent transcriptional regulator [Candidatus Binataceae bacterium]
MRSKLMDSETPFAVERTLIGDHPTIVKLRALVERVAATDVTVLVSGESGTGKEVVARSIHTLSGREAAPFIPVNCAAIPNELIESELFGHERGAFTGAALARQGLFAAADGGTIFLDEIGELPIGLQAKLLRVLEDGQVRPVGADRQMRVNVRVIAASNTDLAKAVKKGGFREDLFYRLQVIPICIPPLRERRSDIPGLTEYFICRIRSRTPCRSLTISREAMVALWSYDWPGNVRELENMIERMSIMCEGDVIETEQLPETIADAARPIQPRIPAVLGEEGVNLTQLVRELEGKLINEALKRTSGNKQAAARLLGLKRTTFSAKLRRCGVIAVAPSDNDEEE